MHFAEGNAHEAFGLENPKELQLLIIPSSTLDDIAMPRPEARIESLHTPPDPQSSAPASRNPPACRNARRDVYGSSPLRKFGGASDRDARGDTVVKPNRGLPVHWADTVLLGPKDRVEVAFVADNPGDWMFHCHILEHHAAGMMGVFRVA